jgi:hypothetical protein
MTGTAADVIRVAKGQVGYREGYAGGHWTNFQKFSPAVPGLEWSQNQAWCATFVSWCFQEAGMPKGSYPVTASVATARDWWKQHNRWSDYPAIGAQCIMGVSGNAHTGLVYAYDADYIYTVEGNTNSSGNAEGDGVYLKKRSRRDPYVYGYGYPAYPAGIVTADPTWKNPAPTTPSGPVATPAPSPTKPTTPAAPVPLTAQAIADAVWAQPLVSPTAQPGTPATRTAGTFLRWQDQHHAEVMGKLDQLTKAIQTLTAALTKS